MIPRVTDLNLSDLEREETHKLWVELVRDGLGRATSVPVLVARGAHKGPVVGITAAVHGNELNGIPVIHRLFRNLPPAELRGTVVAVPVVNVPGYLREQRLFSDEADLNRLFPGRANGNDSQVYAHRFVDRIVSKLDYLIDLHTASFGRVNSLYVRADMRHDITATMARLIGPQIIVHNEGTDGTLRSAADDLGIHSITVEVGDPQRFQRGLIRASRRGIQAVLDHLDMFEHEGNEDDGDDTVECARSYWIYTDTGGTLVVSPGVADRVEKGQTIATLTDIFGQVVREYTAPEDGVVVGKSTNPVAYSGARILHLGVEGTVAPG